MNTKSDINCIIFIECGMGGGGGGPQAWFTNRKNRESEDDVKFHFPESQN